jgi:hypothetical protein
MVVVIAAVAALWLTRLPRPITLDPARPQAADEGTPTTFPASQIAATLSIPTTDVQRLANSLVPESEKLTGGFDDPPKLTRTGFNGHVKRGAITIRPQPGAVIATTALTAAATGQGHFDPGPTGGVGVTVDESTAAAEARVTVTPRLSPSFALSGPMEVDPGINSLNLGKIRLDGLPDDLANAFRPGIEQTLRAHGNRAIRQLATTKEKEIWKKVNDRIKLRDHAARLWAAAHVVRQIGSTPNAWLVVKPSALQAAVGPITADQVAARIGVSVNARVVVQDSEPANEAVPFPPKLVIDESLAGRYDLRVPVQVLMSSLDDSLTKFLRESVGGVTGGRITIESAELGTLGKAAVVKVRLMAEVAPSRLHIGGVLYALAEPQVDQNTRRLTLHNIKLDAESGRVLKAASPWLEKILLTRLGAVEREWSADPMPILDDARRRANEQLAWTSDIPHLRVRAAQTMGDLKLLELRLSGGQAVAVFQATGEAAVNVISIE